MFHVLRRPRTLCLPAIVACAAALPPGGQASDASGTSQTRLAEGKPAIEAVELQSVGFGGYYKVGCWTSARLSVRVNRACRVSATVIVPDPEGSPTETTVLSELPRAGDFPVELLFKNGRSVGRPRFRVREADAPQYESVEPAGGGNTRRSALSMAEFLVAAIGTPAGLGLPVATGSGSGTRQPATRLDPHVRVVGLESPDELSELSAAFDSLDVLVIAGRYHLDEPRAAAVRDWVQQGGHVIVSVGVDVAAWLDSPLGQMLSRPGDEAALIPLSSDRPVTVREFSALESFSDERQALEVSRRQGLPAALLDEIDGSILVETLGRNRLIVRTAWGLGRVTFVAFDLDRPPISEWPPVAAVMNKLLAFGGLGEGEAARAPRGSRLAHAGMTDLASQLNQVVQHFPDIPRPSLWTVMGLLVLYLMVIGPLDYLVVRRLLGRPHLTWITFPLLVVAAAVLAARSAADSNGSVFRANQLDVIDVDQQLGGVRTTSWATVYSPESRRYEITAAPAAFGTAGDVERPLLLSWSGIPENVFGGMYRTGGLEIARPAYRLAPALNAIENLPVSVWSTRVLSAGASWHDPSLVESDLSLTASGLLDGRIEHHLPTAIEDWFLVVGRRVYLPGRDDEPLELAPGVSFPPEGDWDSVRQRELSIWLTGAFAVRVVRNARDKDEEYRLEQRKYAPFDPAVADPAAEILRMITFHRAAGGKVYTGLNNDGLRRYEWTDLLDLNRAVLFGRVDLPVTQFHKNGEALAGPAVRRQSFVRIALPVRPPGG